MPEQLLGVHGLAYNCRCAFSYIHPNASTHGPPTSSAVQVNQGSSGADHRRSLPTELEARLHPVLKVSYGIALAGTTETSHANHSTQGAKKNESAHGNGFSATNASEAKEILPTSN
jgi:hypothetical protein